MKPETIDEYNEAEVGDEKLICDHIAPRHLRNPVRSGEDHVAHAASPLVAADI